MKKITVSCCNINQHCLDFKNNLRQIKQSIIISKNQGSRIRVGSELEICGYSCEDHFLENDTELLSWLMLAELLNDNTTDNILSLIGMPVMFQNTLYNCVIYVFNRQILLIRPKKILCTTGNYREIRYFTPWGRDKQIFEFILPEEIRKITSQNSTKFGDAILKFNDVKIGTEMCEELWAPKSPHIDMGLQGVDIICNSSASHHQFKKLHQRVDLITCATRENGGAYIYSNQIGCDGNRLYFDGSSMISLNGKFLVQCQQFSLENVTVKSATFDIREINEYRNNLKTRGFQCEKNILYPEIFIEENICVSNNPITKEINIHYYDPMEEICNGPALWLWDYLKKSGLSGFFLPLSGGVDSCSVAIIVYSMCNLLFQNIDIVIHDLQNVIGDSTFNPKTSQDICNRLFYTCYMSTDNNSEQTQQYAKELANSINSNHNDISIQKIVDCYIKQFDEKFNFKPKFKCNGGGWIENLALQNLQARNRMILAYLCGQLLPTVNNRKGGILVLSSGNVDEALVGYYTKYDSSSGDLNPIGSISKENLKKFLLYCSEKFKMSVLKDIVYQAPTAELEPITSENKQTDEKDLGMTYKDISYMGTLRKEKHLGPVGMARFLISREYNSYSKDKIKTIIKKFFNRYAVNRHKITTLTPSYHAEDYSPDDNRYDLRPFLYKSRWELEFSIIDNM